MKALFLSIVLSFPLFVIGQGVAINEDNSDAHSSAILDVKSTSKGLLFPRMTSTQRNGISSPATGLTVYQTNGETGLYYFDGSAWVSTSSSGAGISSAGSGLSLSSGVVSWGGALSSNSTISMDTRNVTFNSEGGVFSVNMNGINSDFIVRDGSNSAFVVDGVNGNVGVGTANPVRPLDVQGKVALFSGRNGDPTIRGINSSGLWTRIGGSGSGIAFWGNNNVEADNSPQLYLSSTGLLGVGTVSPGANLDVLGSLQSNNGFVRLTSTGAASSGNVSVGFAGFGNVKFAVESSQDFAIYSTGSNSAIFANGPAGGTTNWNGSSDKRLKQNIIKITNGLETVSKLNGVSYTFRHNEFPKRMLPTGQQVGLIAQEVQAVVPEVVTEDNEGYLSIAYGSLVPHLIEAIKEQQAQIAELKGQVNGLESQLQSSIESFEKRLKELEALSTN